MAVGDIESVQRTATLQRMAMQVSFVAEVENKYPRFITRRIYNPLLELKPNARKGRLGLVLICLSCVVTLTELVTVIILGI